MTEAFRDAVFHVPADIDYACVRVCVAGRLCLCVCAYVSVCVRACLCV